MTMSTLVDRTAALGIGDFGVTDHLHSLFNWPDVEASRREFLDSNPSPRFHFGIEISCMSQWELSEIAAGGHTQPTYGLRQGGPAGAPLSIALDEALIKAAGIEYVVGGTHWPMYVELERDVVIRDYHRQNMFLATHPLVDIVAHPWWWMGKWQEADGMYRTDPWLDDFRKIPSSMHDEFASAALQHGKVVEINLSGLLLNPNYPEPFRRQYTEYLAWLQGRGVTLSLGSDCHNAEYAIDFEKAERMLEAVGVDGAKLWTLPPRRDG